MAFARGIARAGKRNCSEGGVQQTRRVRGEEEKPVLKSRWTDSIDLENALTERTVRFEAQGRPREEAENAR